MKIKKRIVINCLQNFFYILKTNKIESIALLVAWSIILILAVFFLV